ncbi:hypothetical protein ACHAWO_009452 [Cyclotella atomus]|uniref:Uncharacterized protein n=1 Tax=Cyclotella atomus TaxID=382360 RepID=A0ABD3PVC6_9STRA
MDLPFAVPDPPQPVPAAAVRQNALAARSGHINTSSQTHQNPQLLLPQQNGGLLYHNLIPGHYRYGARPPAPPPGPLSVESSQQRSSFLGEQPQNMNSYSNVQNHQSHQSSLNREVFQVSEPEDPEDDDLLVVDLDEDEDDDGRLYRPFRHSTSNGSLHTKSDRSASTTQSKNSKSKSKKVQSIETKPIDLLAVLLGESSAGNSSNNLRSDISNLIEDATMKSRRARSMTTALATKDNTQTEKKAGNDLYVDTANAHTEAALAFQRVYRSLLGIDDNNAPLYTAPDGLAPSEELAKSMLILANGHVRMEASLKDMGVKWNMGKAESFGIVKSNSNLTATKSGAAGNETKNTSTNEKKPMAQHERIRLAVRGALDTANHEADITNSTFLARSFLNAKPAAKAHPNGIGGRNGNGNGQVLRENPIDDLMKLEKELKGMDMALEVGASVSNLGATFFSRPDGSFCVVPPGSNYMSSSFMWSSGIMGKVGNQQQNRHNDRVGLKAQTGTSAVRSRANHLQHFLGGNRPPTNPHPPAAAVSETPVQGNSKQDQSATNGGLSESWWGGGQGSMMASVALSTVTASHQKGPAHPTTSAASPRAESANTKQLMQLMDSLKRLGDENAQLMREVEEAKAARSEAVAAKNMMEKFKKEYSQRFSKVKEALEKYPRNAPDNPVSNSNYMKSASMAELQKRDQMIKTLAADLRKEREDSKKKDAALRKYEGFYKEVKARSAEKAKQRKMQEAQQKVQPQNQG